MIKKLPKYTENKKKGNIGEAIAQYVLSTFSLVHKIDGSNDVGNDFICELIKNQYPTNLLFYVQVKYTTEEPRIKQQTLEYWKGSPIPVYLFWIKDRDPWENPPSDPGNLAHLIRYKRCTPFLHKKQKQDSEHFQSFDKFQFIEHLIRDYVRISYAQGFTPIVDARDFLTLEDKRIMHLGQYHFYIEDVLLESEYSKQILKNGWVNMLSLAVTLGQKGDRQSQIKASSLIKLAKTLVPSKDRRKYESIVKTMEDLDRKLSKKLNKSH